MSYVRGGKVWIESKTLGFIALREDWAEDDPLPEDLVSEQGWLGINFKLADPSIRAAMGGYSLVGKEWFFFLSDQTIEKNNLVEEEFYLLGDLNNWELSSEYKLTRAKDGLGLLISQESLSSFKEFEFKFCTFSGKWIEPHPSFPCFPDSVGNVRNGWFHYKRTGRDLLTFELIEPMGIQGLEKWLNYRPEGSFGFDWDGRQSSFRIFAPRAEAVELLIYSRPKDKICQEFHLISSEDGSWSISMDQDFSGYYYHYLISQKDARGAIYSKQLVDPYAKALVGRNGPGIAVKKPPCLITKGFQPPKIEDVIVVEAHLRDLLSLAPGDFSQTKRLEFQGLTQWLTSEDCYLRQLGANVVELQPVHEFDARSKGDYHWGYMPVNFFSPASSYNSCAEDGSVIKEFAELVSAFHDAGLAVVLDVVYNHVGIPPHLIHLDRDLYCLTDERGNLTNHSGCGNDLRCDAEPVKKLVLDSLIYWVEVFDVDGFRFDLGELLGRELLTEIEIELNKIKPGVLLFAEPWSFRGRLPIEMNQTGYSLWSDACREQLLKYAKNQTGNEVVNELLLHGLDKQNKYPAQSVIYLESHDDFSLVDRFRDLGDWSIDDEIPPEVIHRIMISMGLLLVAPGVPMISAGQDFLRHKSGVRNTYLRGDLNALNYKFLEIFSKEVEFIRKLIQLRKSEPGRRARHPQLNEWLIHHFASDSDAAVIFGWESKISGEKYLVCANPTAANVVVGLPDDWSENVRLLAFYGTDNENPKIIHPLSFSWFGSE